MLPSVVLPAINKFASLALKTSVVGARAFGAAAPLPTRECGVVPPGHINSDLSSTVCHIGLGRRRDLTLRQDLSLFVDGAPRSMTDLFKGRKVIVVGFPGGPICTQQHIPGYVEMTPALERKGVDQVLCITPDTPQAVQDLAKQPNLTSPKVGLAADPNGAFIRLLGLELNIGADKGPKCQRFAGIVEDGVLLKVKVENTPKDLKQTDAQSMCNLWEDVYGHLAKAGAAKSK